MSWRAFSGRKIPCLVQSGETFVLHKKSQTNANKSVKTSSCSCPGLEVLPQKIVLSKSSSVAFLRSFLTDSSESLSITSAGELISTDLSSGQPTSILTDEVHSRKTPERVPRSIPFLPLYPKLITPLSRRSSMAKQAVCRAR